MSKKTTDHTALTGDAEQAVAVLAWSQSAGMSVSSVTVGACHIELHRTSSGEPARAENGKSDLESIYAAAVKGSPLEGMDFGIPGGEMQPVVGRTR